MTLAPKIRVNCIAPGGVEANQDEEFIKKLIDRVKEYISSPTSNYCSQKAIKH